MALEDGRWVETASLSFEQLVASTGAVKTPFKLHLLKK